MRIKSMAQTVAVVIGLILAFLVFRGINPEKFIKPDTQIAGEDIPRLSGKEEFVGLVGTKTVTAEPDEVIATGIYSLNPWVNPYQSGRGGRRKPYATDSAITAAYDYQEFYLIRLPDQTYILAQFSSIYKEEIEKGGTVTLPAGVKKSVNSDANKYLKKICEAYGADSTCVLYMIDDEWQQAHDPMFFWIKLGAAVLVFFVIGVPLFAFADKITGGKEQ